MKKTTPRKILISPSASKQTLTREILHHFPTVPIETTDGKAPEELSATTSFTQAKRQWLLTETPGQHVKPCPGTDRKYRCCNYQVINQTENCPLDCTYCILQTYLNTPYTTIQINSSALLDEVKRQIISQPRRIFRFGTGELGDSLALEPSRLFAAQAVKTFAEFPNALLELKTKTSQVEFLLPLDHQGHTVVSWSVNPPEIIKSIELGAASLSERLAALAEVQEEGYLIGLHFDPILHFPGWREAYENLIRRLFQVANPERIAWISMGSLRFPPGMREVLQQRWPKSVLRASEFIKGQDGKLRYPKPLRLSLYKAVYEYLHHYGGERLFIYFCMESADVWDKVFGWAPESNEHLDYLFAHHLYSRFTELKLPTPTLEIYLEDSTGESSPGDNITIGE